MRTMRKVGAVVIDGGMTMRDDTVVAMNAAVVESPETTRGNIILIVSGEDTHPTAKTVFKRRDESDIIEIEMFPRLVAKRDLQA